MSVSSFPYGCMSMAGCISTLTLNNLNSSDFDLSSPYNSQAGVRVLTTGAVQELGPTGSWSSQNPGVEWIDDFCSGSASDYEVRLSQTSSTGTATRTGPTLASFHTISATQQWTWTKTNVGSFSWTGTMTIREIANTSNTVSATVTISIENGSL